MALDSEYWSDDENFLNIWADGIYIEMCELWVFGHYSGKCEVFCLHENLQMKISLIYNGQNMILKWRQIFEIKSSQQQNQVQKKNIFQIRTGLPLESQLFQKEANTIVDI